MIKLVDQLSPMGNFAVATATDIVCSDNERLQDKIDNGTLGGDNSIITTEAEYLALPEEERLNNSYYLYDIGVHYKNGVAYSRKKPIQLTMEEYKALGEVDPDQEYIVSADEQGILLEASDIGYSNAVSNLPCTTVQGAIDAVYDSAIKNKSLKTYTTLEQLGLADGCSVEDIYLALPDNSYFECGVDTSQSVSGLYNLLNVPKPNGLLTIRKYNSYRFSLEYKLSANGGVTENKLYIGQLQGSDGSGLTWSRVCTTSVADVPITTVDLTGTDIHGIVIYLVKSGICYVSAWGVNADTAKTAHILVPTNVMPKPAISGGTVLVHGDPSQNGKVVGQLYIDSSEALSLHIYPNGVGHMGYGSFSYPVAES